MKANGLRLTVLAVLISFALILPSAKAASSGSLMLDGIVPQEVSLEVSATSSATNLDIVAGMEETIGAGLETCNSADGYKIEMYSDNEGDLVNESSPNQKIQYQISYDGGAFVAPPSQNSPQVVKDVRSLNKKITNTSRIRIKIDPNPDALAGQYSDKVIFSIIAN